MYVRVKVFPDSKKEVVVKEDERLTLYVREPASKNLANRRVIFLIAKEFSVSENKVHILTGHKSQNKLLEITE